MRLNKQFTSLMLAGTMLFSASAQALAGTMEATIGSTEYKQIRQNTYIGIITEAHGNFKGTDLEGKVGVFTVQGETVIPSIYDNISTLSNGNYQATQNGAEEFVTHFDEDGNYKWSEYVVEKIVTYFNKDGVEINEAQANEGITTSNVNIRHATDTSRYETEYKEDENGNYALEARFYSSNGIVTLPEGHKFETSYKFDNKILVSVSTVDGDTYFLNNEGQKVLEGYDGYILAMGGNEARINEYINGVGYMTVIDSNGNVLLNRIQGTKISVEFGNGYRLVNNNVWDSNSGYTYTAVVYQNGQPLRTYENTEIAYETYYKDLVFKTDDLCGLMDYEFNVIIEPTFTYISYTTDDYVIASNDWVYGMYAKDGAEILPQEYSAISPRTGIYSKYCYIRSSETYTWGLFDLESKKIVVEPTYYDIVLSSDEDEVEVVSIYLRGNDSVKVIDTQYNTIIEAKSTGEIAGTYYNFSGIISSVNNGEVELPGEYVVVPIYENGVTTYVNLTTGEIEGTMDGYNGIISEDGYFIQEITGENQTTYKIGHTKDARWFGEPPLELNDAVLYTSYSVEISGDEISLVSGALPKGLGLYEDGVISGVLKELGTSVFTLNIDGTNVIYSITVVENTDENVNAQNDFEIMDRMPVVENNETDYSTRIDAEFETFLNVYLNGVKLSEGVDFEAEEGSTKITIKSQTLSTLSQGTHTINATFTTQNTSTTVTPTETPTVTTTSTVAKVTQNFTKTAEVQTAKEIPFTDVQTEDWYYDAVKFTYQNNLLTGSTEVLFAPTANMTRAMMVTLLHRLAGTPEASDAGFEDVAQGSWYSNAINWAYENGIVNGTSATTFAPGANISRQDMAVMLARYCERFEVVLPTTTSATPTDLSSVADYAKNSSTFMYQTSILSGDTNGNFKPTNTATRAEVATMIRNFVQAK